MLNLKLAQTNDAQLAMSFIDQAKTHLKAQGIDQWQTGYPDLACIEADIALQKGYFLADGETPTGYLCIDFAGEPMQHILKKSGFTYCGTIWFDNSEKIAFDKLF